MDSGLKREIEEKILSGSRLSFDDGVALYDTDEVAWLGALAHEARKRKNGDKVYFSLGAEPDGDPAAAASVVYGGDEKPRHLVEQLLRLREQQDANGGLVVFSPLRSQDAQPLATGVEALKTFAVSRLLLDNVDHIRCSWALHGESTAQLALNYGADDLDTPDTMAREDLLELIRDAGFTPVERNARYKALKEFEGPDPARREQPQPMRF